MKPIHNWRDGWRFWSVRIQVAGLFLITLLESIPETVYTAWEALPPELHNAIPEGAIKWVAYITLLGSIVARMIRQDSLHDKGDIKAD